MIKDEVFYEKYQIKAEMYVAAEANDVPWITRLLSRRLDVDVLDDEYQTPLPLAAIKNNADSHFDTIAALLKNNASVNKRDYYDKTALHYEAAKSNLRTVKQLLDHKADVSIIDRNTGETPLFQATRAGNTEVLKLLVDYGTDVNHQAKYGVSPLHVACCKDASGDFAIVELLLRSGANVNAQDRYGRTPLHYAVSQNKVKTVQLLLDHHADVEGLDNSGSTPLHEACKKSQNFEVVKVLLRKGAQVDTRDNDGKTPLYYSTSCGEVRAFKLLLDYGATFSAQIVKERLLLNAARCGNIEMARMLLEEVGFDINSKSASLLEACGRSPNYQMIDLLLKSGAKIDAVNSDGNSALHLSAWNEDVEVIKLLLDHKVNVNYKNLWFGETALFSAVNANNVEIVKLLLEHRSDVNYINKGFVETSLLCAAKKCCKDSHHEVIKLLLKRKADLNVIDKYGKTPLDYLVTRTNVRTIGLALKFGARSWWTSNSLLVEVLRDRCFENAQVLVDHGSDLGNVDVRKVLWPSPWADRKHLELIKFYYKNGKQLDDRLLMKKFVDKHGSYKVLRLLLKYSDAVNDIEDDNKGNILNYIPPKYKSPRPQPPKLWKNILRHIAKLRALKMYVHPSLINTITKNNLYNDYFQLCENELIAAKNRKIGNSWITFFDLFVGSKRKLKNYAGNRDLINAFKKSNYKTAFPKYEFHMQRNVEKGVSRRKFYDKASILLSKSLPIFNPMHLIVRDTLDCISTKELSKLCE